MTPRPLLFLLLSACLAGPAGAQEWTRFRGPNGTGISPARGLPVAWTEADFRWRVRLPGSGHGAPVAWGDRLFVTAATDEGRERAILGLDRRDGRELWRRTYALPTHRPGNRNAGYANSSPVVDADRVFAVFVSADHFWVRAFDHAGGELWSQDLGVQIKIGTNARAQIIDTQVNRAQVGKTAQPLHGRLVHMAGTDGGHHRQTAHGIEPGADDAAVDAVVAEMSYQLWLHLDTGTHLRRPQVVDFQAEHPIKRNHFFEYFFEPVDKFFLKNNIL